MSLKDYQLSNEKLNFRSSSLNTMGSEITKENLSYNRKSNFTSDLVNLSFIYNYRYTNKEVIKEFIFSRD